MAWTLNSTRSRSNPHITELVFFDDSDNVVFLVHDKGDDSWSASIVLAGGDRHMILHPDEVSNFLTVTA